MSSQSLPSFAQAFSALDDRDRALPPIHSHSPYLGTSSNSRHDVAGRRDSHTLPPLKRDNRKRARDRDDDSSEPESPRIVKQEQDIDQLEPSPPPHPPPSTQAKTKSPPRKAPSPARPTTRARQQLHLNTNVGNTNNASNAAPSANNNNNASTTANTASQTQSQAHVHSHVAPPPLPAATHSLTRQQQHPSKRRRVTISGVAHPNMSISSAYSRSPAHSNAHTPPPASHTGTGPSTPISPVVMGFTIQRENPQAFEQVRAMLAVKQKQKALIESRRGSAAGLAGVDGIISGGRRGSTAGVFDTGGSGSVSGRRASVAAPNVTVNVVNPTPTSATGPGTPGPAPPLRRTGSSPNGHRLTATTSSPSLSPNARANANRTRSPSLLGQGAPAARPKSPVNMNSSNQTQSQTQVSSRSGPAPLPSSAGTNTTPATATSNLSPPSSHPHPHQHQHQHQQHPQANPHSASSRTRVPSPPQINNTSGTGAATAATSSSSGNGNNNTNNAPPSSSSSPPSAHANANPNPSQGQGGSVAAGSGSGSTSTSTTSNSASNPSQSQSQNQPTQNTTFVASQGLSALAHNLPPPPNSFTKRRGANQFGALRGGNKPADLMISPRDSEVGGAPPSSGTHKDNKEKSQRQHPPPALSTPASQTQTQGLPLRRTTHMPSAVPVSAALKSLQPAIQSAPPRPGQLPGRFPPMALPSLPPILSQTSSGHGHGHSGTQQQHQQHLSSQTQGRGAGIRKTLGQVPPTPTSLSMQRAQGTTESASVRLSQPTALSRVPRTATGATFAIPPLHGHGHGALGSTSSTRASATSISSGLVMPATPATLHRASAGGSGGGVSMSTTTGTEKAAFLAPFEQFYDALSDAQVLKGWFGEQLRRVGALAREGEAQLAKLKSVNKGNNDNGNNDANSGSGVTSVSKAEVESLVREAVAAESRSWKDEVARLRAQVSELQELLMLEREKVISTAGGRPPVNGLSPRPTMFQPTPPTSTSGAGVNLGGGYQNAPSVDASYTFPPVPGPGSVPGRPPTAPASTSLSYHHPHSHSHHPGPPPHHHHHHQHHTPSHLPHHPHHSSSSFVDERGYRRSVSPPLFRERDRERGREGGRDVSEGASVSGYGGGNERSLSRSAASSPVPSLDNSTLGGISRRLSVSAMRFEKLERANPERDREREREREREKDRGRDVKMDRDNDGGGGGGEKGREREKDKGSGKERETRKTSGAKTSKSNGSTKAQAQAARDEEAKKEEREVEDAMDEG